jgi:uroporphyrinogen-III synthase
MRSRSGSKASTWRFFVSRNAVRSALALLVGKPWPAGLKVATVGQGSREELEQQASAESSRRGAVRQRSAACAARAGAVRASAMSFSAAMAGAAAGETLRERGRRVEYAACYRRVRPAERPAAARRDARRRCGDAVLGRGPGKFPADARAKTARRLAQIPFFVPHPRIAEERPRRACSA